MKLSQQKPILTVADLNELLSRLDKHTYRLTSANRWPTSQEMVYNSKYRGAFTLLFWTGLRVSECLGDNGLSWRVLSPQCKILSNTGNLPEDWIKSPESSGLWELKSRPPNKGLIKEDLSVKGNILYVHSDPLKHGRRDRDIELSTTLPHVNFILNSWRSTDVGERIFKVSRKQLWFTLYMLSGLKTHSFRASRAMNYASDPNIDLASILLGMGWRRSQTADSYISQSRSFTKLRESLDRQAQQGMIEEQSMHQE